MKNYFLRNIYFFEYYKNDTQSVPVFANLQRGLQVVVFLGHHKNC